MVTVKRDAAGRWFVSFMVEEALRAAGPAPNPVVAVDLGLKDLLTDSGGGRVAPLRALQRRLRTAPRPAGRVAKRRRVARLHARPTVTCPGGWRRANVLRPDAGTRAGRVHVQVDKH